MILVAGLTPAWQQIVLLNRLRTGEVNRAREVHWCASGKVLNVGLALTQLGVVSRTLSLVGGGPAGEAIRGDFAKLGVDVRWIESAGTQRVCTTLLDVEMGTTTEIVENSAAATPSELQVFADAFVQETSAAATDLVILTGSLPTATPSDFFAVLLQHTRVPAILDIRGPELLAALPHRPLLVKPNHDELAHTVGRVLADEDDVWQAMSELHARGTQWVVVTNGSRDVLATDGTQRLRFTPPCVDTVNPIGCGDCFTAGLAGALRQGAAMPDAIRSGIAAAAQNATQLLPARLNAQALGHSVTASTA